MKDAGIIDKTGAKYHLKACWNGTFLGGGVTSD
jgi:hypothetical protein